MTIRYDKKNDELSILLGPDLYENYDYDAGDFIVTINEPGDLVHITIANARKFITQALAAGVEVEGAPKIEAAQPGLVWHDADSSMISAYAYDETTGVLEVAFHRTGVYRYHQVPRHVFEGLHAASSKGSYMRGMIIDMYPYEKKRGRSRR